MLKNLEQHSFNDDNDDSNKQSHIHTTSFLKKFIIIHVEDDEYEPPKSGTILLQVLVLLLFFILVTRFWFLQVHKGKEFTLLSESNRFKTTQIFAPRGRIMDVNGNILADNRPTFNLSLTRSDCQDIPATLAQISMWSNIPLSEVKAKLQRDSVGAKNHVPITILSDLTFQDVAVIESELYRWPGVEIEVRTKREYTNRYIFTHILGYVAEANEQEIAKDSELSMGDFVGRQGLEYSQEKILRGHKGLYELEVDAHALVLSQQLVKPPKSGDEIRLTIDADLQQACWDILEGAAGSIVILEPDSGKIRALVASPSYDNNLFANGISRKDMNILIADTRSPLQNRAIQSAYPPGSVWKLVMALMLLENGYSPHETVFCPGQVKLGNHIFRCWRKGGHGSEDMTRSIVDSCDVYYYLMGDRAGIERLHKFATACGFGQKTGIDLPNEKTGLVPSREWKLKRKHSRWSRGDSFNVSIGQGDDTVTPLQVAVFVGALLNGGEILKPQLIDDAPREVRGRIPASTDHIKFVLDAMHKTATYGTAKVVARKDAIMGGKTGTAQVTKLRMVGERRLRTSELEYKYRDHAWIATWGIKNDKKYVVIVMFEHGGGGSSIAGPVAKKIYDYLFGSAA